MKVETLVAVLLAVGLLMIGFGVSARIGWLMAGLLLFSWLFDGLVTFLQGHRRGDFTAWQVILGFLVIDVAFGWGWGWSQVGPLLLCEAAAGLWMTLGSWRRRAR